MSSESTSGAIRLTDEQLDDMNHIRAITKGGRFHKLNLGDPRQYRHAVNLLKSTGETPDTSPHTFRMLERAHATQSADPPEPPATAADEEFSVIPFNAIAEFGTTNQTEYTASALSTIPGGTQKTTTLLTLRTATTAEQIGYVVGSSTEYLQGENFVVPASGTLPAGLQNQDVLALATFYVYVGEDPIPTVYEAFAEDSGNPTDACMLQPIYKQYQGSGQCMNKLGSLTNNLILCWNRTPGNINNCDYYWTTGQPPTFSFPVSGSMTFPFPVANPLTGMLIMTLQPTSGGAAVLSNLNSTGFSALPVGPTAFGVSGNTVSWNFPASAFPNNGKLPTGGVLTYFNFFLSVLLQSSSSNVGTGTFTSNPKLWKKPATYPMPVFDILYGCLAEGTQIRMADGSLLPIQSFDGGGRETILVGEAKTPGQVVGTTRGTEPIPLVFIRDDKGHSLLLTEGHALTISSGVVLAGRLRVGDVVTTEDGPAKLVEVGRKEYYGDVWNLMLGTEEEAARAETTMYANGILVGDVRMQRYFGEAEKIARTHNPLNDLPPEWHEDYLNYVNRGQKVKVS